MEQELQSLREQNARLLKSLAPFAKFFHPHLQKVNEQTMVAPAFPLKAFKDAAEAYNQQSV